MDSETVANAYLLIARSGAKTPEHIFAREFLLNYMEQNGIRWDHIERVSPTRGTVALQRTLYAFFARHLESVFYTVFGELPVIKRQIHREDPDIFVWIETNLDRERMHQVFREHFGEYKLSNVVSRMKQEIEQCVNEMTSVEGMTCYKKLFPNFGTTLLPVIISLFSDHFCHERLHIVFMEDRIDIDEEKLIGCLRDKPMIYTVIVYPTGNVHANILVVYPEVVLRFDPAGGDNEMINSFLGPLFSRLGYNYNAEGLTPSECVQSFNRTESEHDVFCLWYSLLFAIRLICGMSFGEAESDLAHGDILEEIKDLMLLIKFEELYLVDAGVTEEFRLKRDEWCQRVVAPKRMPRTSYREL